MSVFVVKTYIYYSSMTKHMTKNISLRPIDKDDLKIISSSLKCDYESLIDYCLTINSAILI